MKRPWVRRSYDQTRLWMRLPYSPTNRDWILDELGSRRIRPDWNNTVSPRRWEIARTHLRPLVDALAFRFGEVDVYLEFSTTERCDRRCQRAEGDDCTCSCRGEHHGGGVYWKHWTQVGEETLVSEFGRVVRHYLVRRGDMAP
ncbi:hypothetical protein [Streptomyces nigrescens]|uniref:Uncharacterized protein n=1 Tax=Streptomyces nigrescens TaxID=1920 RepID=A0A640TTY5_STRNI|nr:hypothetical protein [Streptomyces libani]WAU00090.1 hypothetical protein STRLI_006307 [Streptomyces libani subsp. libani]GFE25691.1 hypothetical protein Sliba_61440 [Streptomyces libani subsp. libani]GGV98762.1 hypothetical protein GCM10010500_48190 [Streptomyces libani subsp. libani]